jgi:hypothetical protein
VVKTRALNAARRAAATGKATRPIPAQPRKRSGLPYNRSSGNLIAMTTRAVIRALFCFLASVVSLSAQDHPRAPQQSQSQQLPQSAGGAPQAAMTEATMSGVSAGLKEFISGYSAKSADKKFHMPYNRKDLALDLVKVHDNRFSNLGGNKYFACVDMKGADGKMYDIDFFMAVQGSKLNITDTSVHKVNGKPLYNWKQEGGVWKKVKA